MNSHRYASIYETLTALYPLLSVGGYVVFDDWKFVQARGAIMVRCCRIGRLIPVTPRGAGAPGGDAPRNLLRSPCQRAPSFLPYGMANARARSCRIIAALATSRAQS